MIAETDYLNHIQRTFPDLKLQDIHVNREGMVNVAIIVNQERVFRFPREEWGVGLLRNEMNALDLVRKYVDIPVPDWDYRSDEMVSYPFIPGDPLLTDDLLRMNEREKDAVAETLATLLKQVYNFLFLNFTIGIDCKREFQLPRRWHNGPYFRIRYTLVQTCYRSVNVAA